MAIFDGMKRAPLPTAAPVMGLVALDRLYGRQLAGDVCGYVSGIATDSIYCVPGYSCAQNTLGNVRGCCAPPLDFCTIPTVCIGSTDLAASCNTACSTDPLTRICTDAASPYCLTWTWELGAGTTQSQYKCTDLPGLEENNHLNIGTTLAPGQSGSILSLTSAAQSSAALSALPTTTLGDFTNNNNNAAPTTTTIINNPSNGLSQGATIAIAVCSTIVGIAILAFIGATIWWRKRRHERLATFNAGNNFGAGSDRMSYLPPTTTATATTGATYGLGGPQARGYAPPPERAPNDQPPQAWQSPPQVGAAPHAAGAAVSPYGAYDPPKDDQPSHWTEIDDDQLARMRRFSNDGTVVTNDMTVAGRTDDGFRPQGA